MIYPKALNIGDKIGFFSPSSPATVFAPKRFARAKRYLEEQGFILVEGSLTGESEGLPFWFHSSASRRTQPAHSSPRRALHNVDHWR